MKKFLAAMFACTLAFTTCFAVVGCGGGDDAVESVAEIIADDLVAVEVLAKIIAGHLFVAAVEGRVGALGVGDHFAVERYRDQDIGDHADLRVGLLFGFPDRL